MIRQESNNTRFSSHKMMHFVGLIEESNKITNLPEVIRKAKTLVKQLIDQTNEGTNKIFSQKMCYHQ